jgi:hypothetical protein
LRAALVIGALAAFAVLAGCGEDVDLPWDLDHDRIIAIRSTPPRITSGEVATIDALLGRVAQPPVESVPETATVLSPAGLAGALAQQDDGGWTVTAPDAAQLDAARSELGLEAGAPVPLRLRVTFAEYDKTGLKIVWLGEHAENPVLDPVTIDGMDALAAEQLRVGVEVDVPLAVAFDDTYVVNWLTSCGTMHDFDLARAYLRVEPEDPTAGTLGVVVRDAVGGVAWRMWPITAQ